MATSVGRGVSVAALLATVALSPAGIRAETAFTGTKSGVARQNLGLEGGHADDLAVASDGRLYLALNSPNGMFCSTDGGSSWSAPPAGSDFGNVSAVEVGETDATAYVVGGNRLYKTADGCATFTELKMSNGAQSNFGILSIAYAGGVLLVPLNDGTVARSTDGGTTLTSVPLGAGVTQVRDVAASPTAGTFWALVVVNSVPAIFQSTDGGALWSDVTGSFTCPSCTHLRVDPADPLHLVAAGFGGVVRTKDGGTIWDDVPPLGISGTVPAFIGGRIFVGNQFSDDDGATWTNLNDVTTHQSELHQLITRDPTEPTRMFMSSLRGLAKSTDSGASWTDAVTGLTGVQVKGIAQSTDKSTVYLAATAGIARSTDFTSGPTWTYPLEVNGRGGSATAVLIPDPSTPATVLVGATDGTNGIFRSIDGGDHFSEQTISSPEWGLNDVITDFVVAPDGRLFATFQSREDYTGGVLVSTDAGVTWNDFGLPSAPANTVVALGDALVVGAGSDFDATAPHRGLFRWDGSAWTQLSGATVDGALVADLVVVPPDTVYAAVGAPGRGTVLRSTDAGVTWTDLVANGLPDNGWFRSLAVDPNDTNIVYAASGRPAGQAIIFRTADGGASWTSYYEGLVDEVPYTMVVDGLMAGFNTGLFGFDSLACRLRQDGKKAFLVDLTLAEAKVADLAANGVTSAAADLRRLNKKGKPVGKAKTVSFGAQGNAAFPRIKKKGSYRATCRWQDASGAMSADSLPLKKKKKAPRATQVR